MMVFLLSLSVVASPIGAGSIKQPGIGGEPGTWYVGETPGDMRDDQPVILFVQGLNNSASTWFENNDMYLTAYNHGYQTAFLELYDSAGSAKNMWDNGSLLANKIREIHDYFGKELVLVTYSKGGIDSQAALVHYEAYPYVSNVITLGTPHYGSQLADLAYSSWTWWIAAILGQRSDGTYSLQTGYMNYYRSITDEHVHANKNNYYTFAGNKRGSFGSSLYWGGLYLSQFGSNDGAVVVRNASLPNGTMVRVGSWNHDDLKYGSKTFSSFQSYLTLSDSTQAEQMQIYEEPFNESSDSFIRGGELSGQMTQAFSVENGAKSITIDWMSAYPVDEIQVISPNKKMQKVDEKVFQDEQYFQGAWHYVVEIKNPIQGEWSIKADSPYDNAYLLNVHFDSNLSKKIKLKHKDNFQKWNVETEKLQVKRDQLQVSYRIDFISEQNNINKQQVKKGVNKKITASGSMEISEIDMWGAGVYNMTVDIEGLTSQGDPFQRTIIKTIYVDENGNRY